MPGHEAFVVGEGAEEDVWESRSEEGGEVVDVGGEGGEALPEEVLVVGQAGGGGWHLCCSRLPVDESGNRS